MNKLSLVALGATCLLVVACGPKEDPADAAPSFAIAMPVKTVMSRIVDPNAQKFWHSSGSEDTAEGTRSLLPTTDEGWLAAESAAASIAESGNLLMLPGRARDKTVWMKYAHQLNEAGMASLAAVKARNEAKMFETGGHLYEVCQACHVKYLLPFLDPNGNPIKGSPLDPAEPAAGSPPLPGTPSPLPAAPTVK